LMDWPLGWHRGEGGMNERSKCTGIGGGPPHGGGSDCGLPHTLSLANGVAVWVLIAGRARSVANIDAVQNFSI
jgi:hypothetical protein